MSPELNSDGQKLVSLLFQFDHFMQIPRIIRIRKRPNRSTEHRYEYTPTKATVVVQEKESVLSMVIILWPMLCKVFEQAMTQSEILTASSRVYGIIVPLRFCCTLYCTLTRMRTPGKF